MSQENRLNSVFAFWRQHENVAQFPEDKNLQASLLKCRDTKSMKNWLWKDVLGMKSVVDEEKLIFILKLLKDEWDRSQQGNVDVIQSNPELLRRCVSTQVLSTCEQQTTSPIQDFLEKKPEVNEEERSSPPIGRPKSRRLIPLGNGNGNGNIDLVEISQSKDFDDGYLEKSTNAVGALSSVEEFERQMREIDEKEEKEQFYDNKGDMEQKEIVKEEVIENIQKGENEDTKGEGVPKKDEFKDSPKGYKKKVNIMIEKKVLDNKEEIKEEPQNGMLEIKEEKEIKEIKEEKEEKTEKKVFMPVIRVEVLGNGSNRTSISGAPEITMECKGDQSSIMTMESTATNVPIKRDQVEIIGLKARISELEQIIEEMNKHNTTIPPLPKSEKSSPRTLSPKQNLQLGQSESKAKIETTKSGFFGLSFKKKNKRKLVRSESERNMLVASEPKLDVKKKILTPQLVEKRDGINSTEEEMKETPTISNEEYRQEVIRLNKQIVQLQRRNRQKDLELQAIVNEQKHFYPLMTLREIDSFHDDVSNDFVEIVLSCLENKPSEVQQKYLCKLNDCAEVKFAPPDEIQVDIKSKPFHYTEPVVRYHSSRTPSPVLLPLIREDPVKPQEELYRCLCGSFVTRQEEYYYLFQIVSYLYFAPFRQEGLSIISKLDRTFPEMMMIERSLLRNIDKGFINALSDYVSKLRLYIPFILMKDKTLLVLCMEIEKPEFKKGFDDRVIDFQKKYGNKGKIPSFEICIDRICQRVGEITRFMEDILKQVKSGDINYMKIAQTATIALETESALKDAIVEYLELQDVKNVENKFLTIAHKIHDGKRRIRYFGGLKFVTPGEISKDWKMCILCTDVLIIARPFAFGKKTAKEREVVLRFENSPRGRDVSELSGYRFNEEMRIPLRAPIKVMNVSDTQTVHNAFMVESEGITKHFSCVSIRERESWVQALYDLNVESETN